MRSGLAWPYPGIIVKGDYKKGGFHLSVEMSVYQNVHQCVLCEHSSSYSLFHFFLNIPYISCMSWFACDWTYFFFTSWIYQFWGSQMQWMGTSWVHILLFYFILLLVIYLSWTFFHIHSPVIWMTTACNQPLPILIGWRQHTKYFIWIFIWQFIYPLCVQVSVSCTCEVSNVELAGWLGGLSF